MIEIQLGSPLFSHISSSVPFPSLDCYTQQNTCSTLHHQPWPHTTPHLFPLSLSVTSSSPGLCYCLPALTVCLEFWTLNYCLSPFWFCLPSGFDPGLPDNSVSHCRVCVNKSLNFIIHHCSLYLGSLPVSL